MKSIMKAIFSIKSAIIFMLIFAVASGIATFIENDFGSQGSWAVVYDAPWYQGVQVMLGLILTYNIFKYKMYKKNKFPSFLFHLGFIVILIAAGITKYFGYEGIMHIREGNTENRIISANSYVMASTTKGDKTYSVEKKKLITAIGNNNFTLKLNVDGEPAVIKYKKFIPNAEVIVKDDPHGEPIIWMKVSSDGTAKDEIIHDGGILEKPFVNFTFNSKNTDPSKINVNFYTRDGKIYFKSTIRVDWFKMRENKRGSYDGNIEYPFVTGQLYTIGETNFAPKYIGMKAKEEIIRGKEYTYRAKSLSALIVDVTFKDKTVESALYGRGKGSKGFVNTVNVAGRFFDLEWGSNVFKLPFSIKVNDFQLDRYPGSLSPMSYASEVEVIDKKNNIKKPFRIYMNHVLDYQGYRFFQSSYDQDELGTILSVNKDPGKWPTYLGYFLLSLGLFLNILNPKSRFRKLASMIQRDTDKVKSIILSMFMVAGLLQATNSFADEQSALEFVKKYDVKHADTFGTILAQSEDGRIKPIDTISVEVLNKIYRSATFKGMSANQVVLSMMSSPGEWQVQHMVHVYHPALKKLLGLSPDQKNASFNDFFAKDGKKVYVLQKYAELANRKKAAERNKFDKEVIKVDERVNIMYFVFTGEIFKMIPKIGDPNHKWYSPKSAISTFPKAEGDVVRSMLATYFDALGSGLNSGDWSDANNAVAKIKAYQVQYASDIIPSKTRLNMELFLNKAEIFQKLMPVYLLSGIFLLLGIFAKMLKPNISIKLVKNIILGVMSLGFIAHTIGLGLRWYIAQHAPWSDGYESMIYISWAIIFAGIVFSRQSIIALALTGVLSGVTLFVAHLSWMDPQITTLVPVLKSYWLNIHVSIITGSYGFLALSSILGFFTMILFIIKGKDPTTKRNENIQRNITEATRINEMTMILGLSLLTIGNFLGGVWANESWGRYWGWDSKETWALVTILIYAAVVHIRLVPGINKQIHFAVASAAAFGSVLMTYFGVNFYLSGLHSYASGDPIPIPTFVYYMVGFLTTVILLAVRKGKNSKTL